MAKSERGSNARGSKKPNLLAPNLDVLIQAYEARLQTIDGYAQLSQPERMQIARMILDFVAVALDRKDEQPVVDFVRARVDSHIERGWTVASFSQAFFALEEVLIPQVEDVETSRFMWHTLARARAVASEAMAQAYQQANDLLPQRRLAQLRAVTELNMLLSAERDADALCRLAVELGRERLGIDRPSIWLKDGPPGSFRGTFGTDEHGQTRDEREARMQIGAEDTLWQVASGILPEVVNFEPLRNHLGNVVGEGWHIIVPVEGAGGDVLGVLVADQMLTRRAWDEYVVEILKLYGLSVGRLLQGVSMLEMLTDSQQMLRLIINTIPEMIFWKDRSSTYLGCNTRFAQASGVGLPEDVVGLTDYDLAWTHEEADAFIADDREVMESATPRLHIVEQRLRSDGQRSWLETNKVPLFDAQSNIVGILGTAIDVTERIEALEAARGAQQMLQTVIDNVPQTVFWKDRDLVFLGCNAAFARDAQLNSPAEVIGKTDYDMWWADMADEFRVDDRAVFESGEAIINEEGVRVYKDGRRGWSLQSKTPLRDENGEIWAVLGTSDDITERKLAEIALQENETRMALALEAANAGVWELRPQTQETYLGPRWFALLGYEPDEFPQSFDTWVSLLHPEEQESVQAQVMRHIQDGADFALDFRMKAKGGGYRWIHAIGKVIEKNNDGSAAHIIGTHTDITERMQRDRERIEMYVRRTEEVRISTQVAQEIAAATSLADLFGRVVTLIKERFGYYHAQIFRYDAQQEAMVLVAGYGEAGARMLAADHALPRGTGVVGAAAETGQSALATDTGIDPSWRPNPNLPDTRGELAVPIRWRDQVLGILDVQSSQAGALAEDDQLVLEGLCGQIAIAIRNAETLEQVQIFRQFAEASVQGVGLSDLQGNTIYVNPALCQMCGEPSPQAMLGKPMFDYYPPAYHQRLTEEVLPAVLREGRWAGELALLSRSGQVAPTMENFFLIRDQQGNPAYLADLLVDISGQKRAQAEMEERLQELNSLYRAISEEGWQTFREFATLPGGYLYDGIEHKRADDLWLPEIGEAVTTGGLTVTTFERPVAVAPLSAPGGEVVGALGVYDDPLHPLSSEDLNLIEQVANEVAQALESARLSQETQMALAETGALYQTSQALNTANTLDDVLYAFRQSAELPTLQLTSLSLFNRPWVGDDLPEYIETAALWNARADKSFDPVGSRYQIAEFLTASLLRPDEPFAIGNLETDPRVDEAVRALLFGQFDARSVLFLPLVVAGQWIGFIDAYQSQPFEFRESYLRRLMALVGQAAVAVQSILRLQETRTRAQREQQLREISARLRIQPDVDGVLRALTRELGQVLGRRTFATVSGEGLARVTAAQSQAALPSQQRAQGDAKDERA